VLRKRLGLTQGGVGPCTSTYVAGWAGRDDKPPPSLAVRVNGKTVGKVTPWLPRPDVTDVTGLARARGFFFTFATPLVNGDRVEVVNAAGRNLRGSPIVYRISPLLADKGFAEAKGFTETRASVAARFLSGAGLEVGAFTQPTDLPPGATAEYYDRYPLETLRKLYDETCGRPLVAPQYHGEAQSLEGVPPDKTFDFVIANHVIEHLEDPILFLKRIADVLNPAGRAMVIAPNKRFSFDKFRDLTPFQHLVEDHLGAMAQNRAPHYREWAARINGLAGEAAEAQAQQLMAEDFSIHFHVWDENTFVAFLGQAIEKFQIPLNLLFALNAHTEITVVLEKA
jgi:SAM-dependent methyltransferase